VVKDAEGADVPLSKYKSSKAVLIVNVGEPPAGMYAVVVVPNRLTPLPFPSVQMRFDQPELRGAECPPGQVQLQGSGHPRVSLQPGESRGMDWLYVFAVRPSGSRARRRRSLVGRSLVRMPRCRHSPSPRAPSSPSLLRYGSPRAVPILGGSGHFSILVTSQVDVNGASEIPLYTYLKKKQASSADQKATEKLVRLFFYHWSLAGRDAGWWHQVELW
jgi:hypothetical protein